MDTLNLAKKINRIAEQFNTTQKIMIQINTGNDPLKFGFSVKEAIDSCENLLKLKNLRITGVMMIAPLLQEKKELRNVFKETKKIQTTINKQINSCKHLSMGMTTDYENAIEEGATHLRIGTALYGKRIK